jgi:SCY1-like protein 1
MLSESEYEETVIPSVVKLFSSNERAVRVNLLQSLHEYSANLTPNLVNDKIFPHVVSGFSDSMPVLRELTVKSMAFLVPKLQASVVENQVLKHLATCQTDQVAAIRTNTTYCLGKIAVHLSEGLREKVLVPGFTRALRDPFVPARIAGLKSLIATLAYHPAHICCQSIIPAVSPLLIDPVQVVREAAHQAMRAIMERVHVYSETMAETPLPTKEAEAAAAASQGMMGMAGSLGSWAVSSITTKVSSKVLGGTSSNGGAPSLTTGGTYTHPVGQGSGTGPRAEVGGMVVGSGHPLRKSSMEGGGKKLGGGSADDAGWGDDDDMFNDDEEEPTAVVSLSTKARKPSVEAKTLPKRAVVPRAKTSSAPRPLPAKKTSAVSVNT